MGRISSFLTAEELADPYKIDPNSEYAVQVDGSFQWETTPKAAATGAKGKFETGKGKHSGDTGAKPPQRDESKQAMANVTTGSARKGFFRRGKKESKGPVLPTTAPKGDGEKEKSDEGEKPFELADLRLKIPRGAFVAVVGRVGSGKVRYGAECGR